MYADLDVECLRPFDRMLSTRISEAIQNSTISNSALPPLHQSAFLGRMGTDESFSSSIPNAWMASTPFHPFFLMPLESVTKHVNDPRKTSWAEALTGPVALREQVLQYQSSETDIVEYLKTTTMNHTYFDSYELQHSLSLLPPEVIYPFAWNMPWSDLRGKSCLLRSGAFDKEQCKDALRVRENGGYSITYWSHTWKIDGQNDDNIATVNEARKRDVDWVDSLVGRRYM
jgi:inositol phosphorylceramide mannosyltransferase catalytic subunit